MSHYSILKNELGDNVQLCVVSKKRSVEEMMYFYQQGERIFGENHAQELLAKVPQMPDDVQWHFIGHLQTNKVKQILPYVSCIQSLDSINLANEIEKQATKIQKDINVLVEFHIAENDFRKTGVKKEDAFSFFEQCQSFPHIKIKGIMCMGPLTKDTSKIKDIFNEAQELFKQLQQKYDIQTLSMGMSDDYKIALSCGCNMVRVGTYLFEGD